MIRSIRTPPAALLHLLAFTTLGASCDDTRNPEPCLDVPTSASSMQAALRIGGAPCPGCSEQGTSLQGAPDPSAIGVCPGCEEQGVDLQGTSVCASITADGCQEQGTRLQDALSHAAALALSDLMGARLEVVESQAPVTISDGRLMAGGIVIDAAELLVRTSDDRTFHARVTSLGGGRHEVTVDGAALCDADDHGVFVAGAWDDTGTHSITDEELTYACASGVIAKCVAWGYAPWTHGADVHQSCTRLARADYCGTGEPWTKDGTIVALQDALDVHSPVDVPGFTFEAAWGPDGAVCVNETRYVVEDDDGERLVPACLASLPRCASLSEPNAAHGLVANASAHTAISACE